MPRAPGVPDHIVLLLSHLRPTLGLERCALRLVEELPCRVSVVCIGEDADVLRNLVPIEHADTETLGASVRGWRRLRSLRALRSWSRRNTRTVVVAGVWAAVPLLLVRGRARYGVVVWEHSLSSENIARSRGLRLLARVVPVLYRRVACVVAVSEDLARDLATLTRHSGIEVVPNYIPVVPDRARGGPTHMGCTLLTVGSLSVIKNQHLLVQAMVHLPEGYRLLVAGDGPLRASLVELSNALGVSHRIEWLGHVADMATAYEAADVVVQPSLGETFGMVMFEAASIDLPVVTLDYPHSRSLVPRAIVGRLSARDPRSLADAVRRVRDDPPGADDYAAARRERLSSFADEAITTSWLAVLSRAHGG